MEASVADGMDERRGWERSPEKWAEARRAYRPMLDAGLRSVMGTPGGKRGTGLMGSDLCFQWATWAGSRETSWGLLWYPSEKDNSCTRMIVVEKVRRGPILDIF